MTSAETVEKLTELVKMQADLIMEQANALAQFGAIAELEEKVESATEFRRQLTDI